jgi:putative membrane protein
VLDGPAARRWLTSGRAASRLVAGVTFVLAFVVLDRAADASFAAHMTQHMLLVVVLAPAVVLGFAPEHAPRAMTGASFALLAAFSQTLALAIWHVPAVFDAADEHVLLHVAEHATLVVTAMAAWWVILCSPAGSPTRFALCVAAAGPMMLLGVLLTFAATPWYAVYTSAHSTSHALVDQQAGGAIMWGPAGLAYVIAAGWIVAQAIVRDEQLTLTPPVERVERVESPQ